RPDPEAMTKLAALLVALVLAACSSEGGEPVVVAAGDWDVSWRCEGGPAFEAYETMTIYEDGVSVYFEGGPAIGGERAGDCLRFPAGLPATGYHITEFSEPFDLCPDGDHLSGVVDWTDYDGERSRCRPRA